MAQLPGVWRRAGPRGELAVTGVADIWEAAPTSPFEWADFVLFIGYWVVTVWAVTSPRLTLRTLLCGTVAGTLLTGKMMQLSEEND